MLTFAEVNTAIITGELDADLIAIRNACIERERSMAYNMIHSLRPGDRVRFVRGRPRYLIGHQATVNRVMQTYVELTLDHSIGKFSGGVPIRTPMTLIEKVEQQKQVVVDLTRTN